MFELIWIKILYSKEALFMNAYGMKIFVSYKIVKVEFVKFTLLKISPRGHICGDVEVHRYGCRAGKPYSG